jgi:hypothetical protein
VAPAGWHGSRLLPTATEPGPGGTAAERDGRAPPAPPTDPPEAAERLSTIALLGVVAAVAAGLAVRIFILRGDLGTLDGDEATTGLVARHALHQGELPVYYWSSNYGGTLEAFVTAAAFAVFGSSVVTLKAVSIGWYAVACLLTWRVGRRLVGAQAGIVAALLLWVWPASFVWWSTKSRGFYGALVVLGMILALTVLRIAERPERRVDWLVFGFALGLGWWVQPQIATLAIPVVGWLVVRNWRALAGAWVAAPALLLGASPWILWNVRHGLSSFDVPRQPTAAPYATRLFRFWSEGLPMATGLRVPYAMRWINPWVELLYPALLVVVAVVVIKRYGRTGALLVATVVVYAPLYALNPLTVGSAEGRYVFLLAPIVAITLAACVTWRWLAAPALCGAVAMTLFGLSGLTAAASFHSGDKQIPVDLGPLVRALDEEGVRTGVADYGIAFRIVFETDERIVVAGNPYNRYPPYTTVLESGPPPAWIFIEGSAPELRFRQIVDAMGERYRLRSAGGFSVYLLERRFLPGQLPST